MTLLLCGVSFCAWAQTDAGPDVSDGGLSDTAASLYVVSGQIKLDGRSGGFAAQVTLENDLFNTTLVTENNGAFEAADVPGGLYVLRVEFPDYLTFENAEFVVDQNTFVDVTLFRDISGTVRLTVDQAGAESAMTVTISSVNGVVVEEAIEVGETNEYTLPVTAYTFRIEAESTYEPHEQKLTMRAEADQVYDLAVTLTSKENVGYDSVTECACSTSRETHTEYLLFLLLGLIAIRRRP